jgi:hypothetical protein
MPELSRFFGIVIKMYYGDHRRHPRPHFHALYAEDSAVYGIRTGEVLTGQLPRRAHHLVRAWWKLHRTELAENWKRQVRGLPLTGIEPLE